MKVRNMLALATVFTAASLGAQATGKAATAPAPTRAPAAMVTTQGAAKPASQAPAKPDSARKKGKAMGATKAPDTTHKDSSKKTAKPAKKP